MPSQIDINLLSGRAFEIKKERALKAKIQFVAAFVLVCFLGMLVVILGVSALVNVRLNQVKSQVEQEEGRIKQLAFVEDEYLILQNKVALLEDLFENNKDILDGLDYLVANLPEEITISNLGLDNKLMTMTLTLAAPTYEVLNNFLDFAMANVEEQRFSKIEFGDISRDGMGNYGSEITLVYKN